MGLRFSLPGDFERWGLSLRLQIGDQGIDVSAAQSMPECRHRSFAVLDDVGRFLRFKRGSAEDPVKVGRPKGRGIARLFVVTDDAMLMKKRVTLLRSGAHCRVDRLRRPHENDHHGANSKKDERKKTETLL